MRSKPIAIVAAALLAACMQVISRADTVGFIKVTVPASSDAIVSVPFVQKSMGTFTATGTSGGTSIIVAGPMATDAFKDVFYVRMTSGPANGRWSTISGNSSTQFTLSDPSFIASIGAGNTFEVIPHQTLAKVFTDDLLGISFTASTSNINHNMEVLLPDTTTVGTDKGAAAIHFYRNGAWRLSGPATVSDNTILPPDSQFIIRNKNVTPLTFICKGAVITNAQQTAVVRTESSKNDVAISTGNPLPVSLLELGLGGTPAFKTSTSTINHIDELLIFNNAALGTDKGASTIYYYRQGIWRSTNDALDHSTDVIPAGAAIVLRKGGGTPASDTWTQAAK